MNDAPIRLARPDVGEAYGAQFTNAGFLLRGASLPAGTYQLGAYAHSTVSGTFTPQFVTITISR